MFRAVPDLENDELSGQALSINGVGFHGAPMVATNQNPFRQWALVKPDDNGNIPTVDLYFGGREWVDQVSLALGVPMRGAA